VHILFEEITLLN